MTSTTPASSPAVKTAAHQGHLTRFPAVTVWATFQALATFGAAGQVRCSGWMVQRLLVHPELLLPFQDEQRVIRPWLRLELLRAVIRRPHAHLQTISVQFVDADLLSSAFLTSNLRLSAGGRVSDGEPVVPQNDVQRWSQIVSTMIPLGGGMPGGVGPPDQPVVYGRGSIAEAEPTVPGWRVAVDWIFR